MTRRWPFSGKPWRRASAFWLSTVSISFGPTLPAGPAADAATATVTSPAWIVPSAVSEPLGTTTSAWVANAWSPAATNVPAPIG